MHSYVQNESVSVCSEWEFKTLKKKHDNTNMQVLSLLLSWIMCFLNDLDQIPSA